MATKGSAPSNGSGESGGGALEKRPQTKMTTLKEAFDKSLPTLQRAATKALPADRVIGMVISAASRNPKLLECTMPSIIQASMIATELGLQPSAQLGECYLIPRKNKKVSPVRMEADFQLGYRGMLTLMRRSGMLGPVSAHLVFKGEQFEVELGMESRLKHVPDLKARPIISGPKEAAEYVEYVYAVARFQEGGAQFEVMSREEVEAIRNKHSEASRYNAGPWFDHWGEMAKKTVLRRLAKYLPMSSEASRAIAIDGASEGGEMVDPGELGFTRTDDDTIDADYEDVPTDASGTDKLRGALA